MYKYFDLKGRITMDHFSKNNYLALLLNKTPAETTNLLIHDLRNRISIIISSTDYIKKESIEYLDKTTIEQYLDSIEKIAYDISNIIEAYKDYNDKD